MKIVAVDDEKNALNVLLDAIKEAVPQAEIVGFNKPGELLDFVADNSVDIAFLDIQMRGKSGLELARELKRIKNDINIIFTTGYSAYMKDAIALHASGYVLKPVEAADIKREVDNLLYPVNDKQTKAYVRTFGNFELLCDGQPVSFGLSKAKEMLAYLVNLEGASANRRELAAVLFEEQPFDLKQQNYFSKIYKSLKDTLSEHGLEEILCKGHNVYYVDASKIECDAYEYLAGNPKGLNAFKGEYMNQYSWAEEEIGKFL